MLTVNQPMELAESNDPFVLALDTHYLPPLIEQHATVTRPLSTWGGGGGGRVLQLHGLAGQGRGSTGEGGNDLGRHRHGVGMAEPFPSPGHRHGLNRCVNVWIYNH